MKYRFTSSKGYNRMDGLVSLTLENPGITLTVSQN